MTKRKAAAPMIENRKVMPQRPKNADVRTREYLLPAEVDKLVATAAKLGRHGARDALLILMAYRHGLRATELVSLQWSQVDLKGARLTVRRLKRGNPAVHPLSTTELRALGRLRKEHPDDAYLFVSERGTPMSADNLRKLVTRAGEEAALGFPVHPHMLRHACGYKLANDGHDTRLIQDYLGHINIQHTVNYTRLRSDQFNQLWKD